MVKNKGGFTLIELVVVIAVIGILAAVLLPSITSTIDNMHRVTDKQVMTDLNAKLLLGDVSASELDRYSLLTKNWELAFSEKNNDVLIVDQDDIVRAALNPAFVGNPIPEGYRRVSELKQQDPPHDEKNWWDNVAPEPILPEKNSEEYYKLCLKNELNLSGIKEFPETEYFKENSSLERIYLGDISDLPLGTFNNCSALVEVVFAGENINIGERAFRYCSSLEKINLDRVSSIGPYAFINCIKLKNISLESLKTICCSSFNGCSFDSIRLSCVETIIDSDSINVGFDVKELHIDGKGRSLDRDFASFVKAIVTKSALALVKVRLREIYIETNDYGYVKPFVDLTDNTIVDIADENSYDTLVAAAKGENAFGSATVEKFWEKA